MQIYLQDSEHRVVCRWLGRLDRQQHGRLVAYRLLHCEWLEHGRFHGEHVGACWFGGVFYDHQRDVTMIVPVLQLLPHFHPERALFVFALVRIPNGRCDISGFHVTVCGQCVHFEGVEKVGGDEHLFVVRIVDLVRTGPRFWFQMNAVHKDVTFGGAIDYAPQHGLVEPQYGCYVVYGGIYVAVNGSLDCKQCSTGRWSVQCSLDFKIFCAVMDVRGDVGVCACCPHGRNVCDGCNRNRVCLFDWKFNHRMFLVR